MQTLTAPRDCRLHTAHCSLVRVQHCRSSVCNPPPTVQRSLSTSTVLPFTSFSPPLPPLHCLVSLCHLLSSAWSVSHCCHLQSTTRASIRHPQSTTRASILHSQFTTKEGFLSAIHSPPPSVYPLPLSLCTIQPRLPSPPAIFSVTHCLPHSVHRSLCLLPVV